MPSYPSNPALQSGLDAQVEFMTELTRRSYEAMRKLSQLNLHFAQQALQDSVEISRQLLSCSDPLQLASTAANATQPAAQHLRNYQQQLIGLLTGAQLELTRSAEAGMQRAGRSSYAMAEEMARTATQASDAFSAAAGAAAGTDKRGNGAQAPS